MTGPFFSTVDLNRFYFPLTLSFSSSQGQFSQGSIKGLGLVTFSDGTHGEPKNEGKFEGLELVQRCSAATAVQRARQLAADARSMQL